MWTCGEIKKKAWSNVNRVLWTGVLVTLVFILISGFFSGGQSMLNMIQLRTQFSGNMGSLESLKSYLADAGSISQTRKMMVLNLLRSSAGFLSLAATVFLINPLGVGYSRWFLTNRKPEETASFNLLFSSFRQGSYTGILAGTAWTTLWTFIWSLVAGLCFIPMTGVVIAAVISTFIAVGTYAGSGVSMDQNVLVDRLLNIAPGFLFAFIILFLLGLAGYAAIMLNRKYAYFFTTFILAENPTFGAKNALDLSKRMTQGLKGKLFVLDLSFIGWWLLSSLTCGILSLGVMPYTHAAYAEVYISRKTEQSI